MTPAHAPARAAARTRARRVAPRGAAPRLRPGRAPRRRRCAGGAAALPRPRPARPACSRRVRALPEHRVVDRLLRSRLWIWALGALLGGIVAMQVSLLKLNSGHLARGRDDHDARAPERRARGGDRAALVARPDRVRRRDARDGDAARRRRELPHAPGRRTPASAVRRMQPPSDDGRRAARQRRDRSRLARRSRDRAVHGDRRAAATHADGAATAARPARRARRRRPRDAATAATAAATTDLRRSAAPRGGAGRRPGLAVLIERRIGLLFAVFLGMLAAGRRARRLARRRARGHAPVGRRDPAEGRHRRARPARHDHRRERDRARGLQAGPDDRRHAVPDRRPGRGRRAARADPARARGRAAAQARPARHRLRLPRPPRPDRRARCARSELRAIEGLEFIPEYSREYPRDWMASQLLGNVGTDGDGPLRARVPPRRPPARPRRRAPARPRRARRHDRAARGPAHACRARTCGSRSTPNIQDHTEEVLAEVGEQWQPKGATALVMDPRDGSILALANWPRVNANKLYEAPDYAMTNRATGGDLRARLDVQGVHGRRRARGRQGDADDAVHAAAGPAGRRPRDHRRAPARLGDARRRGHPRASPRTSARR